MRPLRLTAVALATSLTAASSAFADGAQPGSIDKTGHAQLTLTVVGKIDQHCRLGQINPAYLGDLTRPQISADADVGLNCNVPFDLKITSRNGGLRNTQHPEGMGPFAGVRGYELTLNLPVELPGAHTVSAQFSAASLVAGQKVSSDGGIARSGAHLHLDLDALSQPGLAAGSYSETIELSISPSV
jgi:hypothetical protein